MVQRDRLIFDNIFAHHFGNQETICPAGTAPKSPEWQNASRRGGGVVDSDEQRLKALRQRAEALAQDHLSEESISDKTLSPAQAVKMLHELRVHQIELEMQNEELRQAQLRLDAERERYYDLYELAPVGYLSVSENGLILQANLSAAKLLREARNQLEKQLFNNFIAPSDQETYYLLRRQLLDTRQTQTCELKMAPKGGQPFWVKLTVNLAQDDDTPREFRIVINDINERKRAELALCESELRFRQLFEKNSAVMLLIDPVSGQILEANKSAIAFYGYPSKTLIGMSINGINVRLPQHIAEETQKVEQKGDNYFHRQQRLATGEVREVEVHSTPISIGDRIELMSIVHDISDRTRAEFALRQSEQALRVGEKQMEIVQRISGTGSWTYNLATNDIWGSAEGMRIFGFPPVAGMFPFDRFEACIAEQDREAVHQRLMGLIHEGGEYDLEFTIMPADGSAARITHSVATLEHDAQGKPLMVLGFVQDITQARMMEERVRQLAFLDPLTALPNRRLLLDRMGQALAANQRSDNYGALMFLDLDNFKPLNDEHGHGIGDALLMEVAVRLLSCVRAVDTVSRIGGDEFVVLLGDLTTDHADAVEQTKKLAEKIRSALAETYLLPASSKSQTIEHHGSASIGVVLIEPQHKSAEGLLKFADAAMYQSKAAGRNRVTFMIERRTEPRP